MGDKSKNINKKNSVFPVDDSKSLKKKSEEETSDKKIEKEKNVKEHQKHEQTVKKELGAVREEKHSKEKNDNKDKQQEKKDKRYEIKKEIMEEKESDGNGESSFGLKIISGIVIMAIIIVFLLKACDSGKTKYNVTFDTNGGTVVSIVSVEEDDTIQKPEDPIKDGYEFAGWYYNDELYDFSKPVIGDIKLEARWIELENAQGITLEQSSIKLSPGGTTTLIATITPENAKDKSLTWVSSDSKIVTVDANGKVTALKEGVATITVTTNDGGFTATTKVTVSSDVIKVTGVTLNKTSLNLEPNESAMLIATVQPNDAANKELIWVSSDPKVVAVDGNGKVTSLKDGTAIITVTTKDGSYVATCTVNVKTVKVTGIRVSNESVTVKEGKTTNVTATLSPTNATNKNVKWKSEDTSIATVSSNGVITGVKAGTTKVTVTTEDGNYSKTIMVTVEAVVVAKDIKISGKTSVQVGSSITLTATITPSDVDDKTVTWTSSDKSIATVTSSGKVKGVSAGTVTITVTSKSNPDVKATWEVTVEEKTKTYSYEVISYKVDENSTEYARIKIFDDKGNDITSSVTATSVQGSRIQIVDGYIQTTATLGKAYTGTITVTVNGTTYNAIKK